MSHLIIWTIACLPGLFFLLFPGGERWQAVMIGAALLQIPFWLGGLIAEFVLWRRRRIAAQVPARDWRGRSE